VCQSVADSETGEVVVAQFNLICVSQRRSLSHCATEEVVVAYFNLIRVSQRR